MLDNANQLPVSGGVILGSLLYIGLSVFALGPIIGGRTIEKSDWDKQCKTALKEKIEASRKPKKIVPIMDCRSTIGSFAPAFAALCNRHNNPDFGGFATNILREQERLRQEAEEKRLALAASQTSSQCSCAATLVANDRIWAIYAGSLRLITPSQISNLSSELTRALNSPHCVGRSAS